MILVYEGGFMNSNFFASTSWLNVEEWENMGEESDNEPDTEEECDDVYWVELSYYQIPEKTDVFEYERDDK